MFCSVPLLSECPYQKPFLPDKHQRSHAPLINIFTVTEIWVFYSGVLRILPINYIVNISVINLSPILNIQKVSGSLLFVDSTSTNVDGNWRCLMGMHTRMLYFLFLLIERTSVLFAVWCYRCSHFCTFSW